MSPSLSPPHKNALITLKEDPACEEASSTNTCAHLHKESGLGDHQPEGDLLPTIGPLTVHVPMEEGSKDAVLVEASPMEEEEEEWEEEENQGEQAASVSQSSQRSPTWEEVEELVEQALGLASDRTELRCTQMERRIQALEVTLTSLQQAVADILKHVTALTLSHPYPSPPAQPVPAPSHSVPQPQPLQSQSQSLSQVQLSQPTQVAHLPPN